MSYSPPRLPRPLKMLGNFLLMISSVVSRESTVSILVARCKADMAGNLSRLVWRLFTT